MDILTHHFDRLRMVSLTDLKDAALDDFQHLRFTPLTVTISLTVLSTMLLFAGGLSRPSPSKKAKKKKKRVSPTEKSNREIAAVLSHFEATLMPEVEEYLENHLALGADDMKYKYNYYEEMMLKELMKLDGVNVLNNDILRDNRKKVIRHIQSFQKRLDGVKREQRF